MRKSGGSETGRRFSALHPYRTTDRTILEMDMPRNSKRIGDVAKAGGVGVETVRFYEREGLIDRPQKPQGGWREYDETALAQLNQVRLAQEFGLTLRDMKAMKARAKGPRAGFCIAVRETLSGRLTKVEAEIAALQTKREALKQWLGQCRKQEALPTCPLYDRITPLIQPKRKPR
jgi:DNA-binding transcriptional MerR regulator